ncbi:hypothetical protein Tco_1550010, partial [Tanacetum coccineum]
EEMESLDFARYWEGDLHDYWWDISTDGEFLGPPPSYTLIRVPVLRLYHRMMAHRIVGRIYAPEKVTMTDFFYLRGLDVRSVNIPYLLAQYLRSNDVLRGLSIVTRELPLIDIGELVKLNICMEVRYDWAWVAQGSERQPDAVTATPRGAEDALDINEGAQAILAPIHVHPPPPPAAGRTMP